MFEIPSLKISNRCKTLGKEYSEINESRLQLMTISTKANEAELNGTNKCHDVDIGLSWTVHSTQTSVMKWIYN